MAEAPGTVMAHAQVVPQLMSHGGGDDEDADRVVLQDRGVRVRQATGDWGGWGVPTMLTPPERVGEHMEA